MGSLSLGSCEQATNETLGLLRYNSHVFIDATFRSTPKGFSNCLVIMIFDLGTQTFVPCAYALMTDNLGASILGRPSRNDIFIRV
ncbi:hypothetical protein HZS_7391 [Henneguya salminicola]|nr:hypothetical protein HZS_7391 [Henneguya salminicola]